MNWTPTGVIENKNGKQENGFVCHDLSVILDDYVCDGTADCPNASDELQCGKFSILFTPDVCRG